MHVNNKGVMYSILTTSLCGGRTEPTITGNLSFGSVRLWFRVLVTNSRTVGVTKL